jgi:hypothetical protein
MVVTFRYELEIGKIFLIWGRKSLFEFVSCFMNHAENLGISLGHTFHPIELKLGVLPILAIEIHRKIYKN